jgi:peptidyl-dipeptidase A
MALTVDEIEHFAAGLAPLDQRANRAWWTASTETSDANEAERIASDLALREALADPEMYAALAAVADVPGDRRPARQAAVLRDRMAPQQISAAIRDEMVRGEARIDRVFNEFRPTLDGVAVDDNAILEILRNSDDADLRRRAYLASKQVGAEVADGVRDLARLRNQAARELGARDYFALTLQTSELDETAVLETLDAVEAATSEPFAAWKAGDDRQRA